MARAKWAIKVANGVVRLTYINMDTQQSFVVGENSVEIPVDLSIQYAAVESDPGDMIYIGGELLGWKMSVANA